MIKSKEILLANRNLHRTKRTNESIRTPSFNITDEVGPFLSKEKKMAVVEAMQIKKKKNES